MAGQLDKEMRNRLAPLSKISWMALTIQQWADIIGIDEEKVMKQKCRQMGLENDQDSELSNLSQISKQTPPQQIQLSCEKASMTSHPIVKHQSQEDKNNNQSQYISKQIPSNKLINPRNSQQMKNNQDCSSSSNCSMFSDDEQMPEPLSLDQKLQEVGSLIQGQIAKDSRSGLHSDKKYIQNQAAVFEEEIQKLSLNKCSHIEKQQSQKEQVNQKTTNTMNSSQQNYNNNLNFNSMLTSDRTQSNLLIHNQIKQDSELHIDNYNNNIQQTALKGLDLENTNRNTESLQQKVQLKNNKIILEKSNQTSNGKNCNKDKEMLMRVGSIEGKLNTINVLIQELTNEVHQVKQLLCLDL
eukprot:403359504